MNVYLNSCEHTQGLNKQGPTLQNIKPIYIFIIIYNFPLACTDRSSCPRGGQEFFLFKSHPNQTCQNVKITKPITSCFPANSGVL